MSFVLRFVVPYARFFGGDTGPAGLVEQRYLHRQVPANSVVIDVGGGEGKLANCLGQDSKLVLILDREATCLDGADSTVYQGSLSRVLHNRFYSHVLPVRGDALSMPFADASVDAIVSSQFLEHINDEDKNRFFEECGRCLKKDGVLAVSTPNADFIENHNFWFSRLARGLIPKEIVSRLPLSLRGPWLEQTLEQWEVKVGHYGHGCRVHDLVRSSAREGFEELTHCYSHPPFDLFLDGVDVYFSSARHVGDTSHSASLHSGIKVKASAWCKPDDHLSEVRE